MLTPDIFKESDLDVLHSLIRAHPLGTWITSKNDVLDVNHIPFLLDSTQGEYGVLKGHVARVNPVWKRLPTAKESIVTFQGANSYISPSWYPSKKEHGKVVPTWNYIVLHAHGIPRAVNDRDWLYQQLDILSNQQEFAHDLAWRVSDAPSDFTDNMIKKIVGIEIPISNIFGKWKSSQNKNTADKEGVISGLGSNEMASYVAKHTK